MEFFFFFCNKDEIIIAIQKAKYKKFCDGCRFLCGYFSGEAVGCVGSGLGFLCSDGMKVDFLGKR